MRKKVRELPPLERYGLRVMTYKTNPFREKSRAYNSLVEECASVLGKGSYKALEWFFSNTAKSMRKGCSSMSVRLRASYWSGNVAGIGYRKVREVVEWMESEGHIEVLLGNKDKFDPLQSHPTIVVFKPSLYDILDLEKVALHIPEERLEKTIVIKDRVTKEEKDYNPTEETEGLEREMQSYNDSISNVRIEFNGKEIPNLEYKRSFSGDLYKGGRLFAHGGSIQLLPEEYRLSHLTLDGEPVVELDYKSIHPNLLYESEAQKNERVYSLLDPDEVCREHDPYSAEEGVIQLDEQLIAKHKIEVGLQAYNPARSVFKESMMRALNCKSFQDARNSLNNAMFLDSKKDKKDRKFVGVKKLDAEIVLEELAEHNAVIQHHFYNDHGVVLQYIDSKIALRVIDYLIQEGETCLAYHDSFAVKKSIRPLLEWAMRAAWKDIMGENQFCFIEKK